MTPAFELTSKLVKLVDPELWEIIGLRFGRPDFIVSWVLTWFSHDINQFKDVQLIFDACLGSHPLFVNYIAAA